MQRRDKSAHVPGLATSFDDPYILYKDPAPALKQYKQGSESRRSSNKRIQTDMHPVAGFFVA